MTAVAAALFLICGTADAQMTDDQIIEYVQSAAASGKDENQIAQELVLRGVSRSQLERLRDRYQGQQSGSAGSSSGSGYTSSGRTLSSSADRDGYIDYDRTGGNHTLSPVPGMAASAYECQAWRHQHTVPGERRSSGTISSAG